MVNPLWSWALTANGLIWLYLMSTGKAWPWLGSCLTQVGWVSYAVATRQWGFVLAGLANAGVQFLGWRRIRVRRRVAVEAVAR